MKMKHRMMMPALFLALCLCMGACGEARDAEGAGSGLSGGVSASEEEGGDTVAKETPSGPVAVGDPYRDFTALLADGSTLTLSDHEGSVILLNFWATWCGPCVGELPAFPRLVEKYGEDLTLIAVDLGEREGTVKSFLKDNGYEFPVALDADGTIGSLYPTDAIPYTVLIGRDGKIAAIHLGARKADEMFDMYCGEIDGLLGK